MSVWGVSDGRAGIERQVLSLIYALTEIAPDTHASVKRLAPRFHDRPQILHRSNEHDQPR